MNADPLVIARAGLAGDRAGARRHGAADGRRLSRATARSVVNLGAIMLLIVAAFIVARVPGGTIFNGSFIVDDFARFMKILTYVGSAFAIVMSLNYIGGREGGEVRILRC